MEKDMKFTTAEEWVRDYDWIMTPQEIWDHKRKWMPGYEVVVHSDLRDRAEGWCKRNLDKQEYHIVPYTHVYAYTYRFENKNTGQQFEEEFIDWVNKGIN